MSVSIAGKPTFVGIKTDYSRNISLLVHHLARRHQVQAYVLARSVLPDIPDVTKNEARAVFEAAGEAPVYLAGDVWWNKETKMSCVPVKKGVWVSGREYDEARALRALGWHAGTHGPIVLGRREELGLLVNWVFWQGYNSVLLCGHPRIFEASRMGEGGPSEFPLEKYIVEAEQRIIISTLKRGRTRGLAKAG